MRCRLHLLEEIPRQVEVLSPLLVVQYARRILLPRNSVLLADLRRLFLQVCINICYSALANHPIQCVSQKCHSNEILNRMILDKGFFRGRILL